MLIFRAEVQKNGGYTRISTELRHHYGIFHVETQTSVELGKNRARSNNGSLLGLVTVVVNIFILKYGNKPVE